MKGFTVVVETVGNKPVLSGIEDRVKSPPFRLSVKAWRAVIAREFETGAWESAGGGRVGWKKTLGFGNREAPGKTLIRTGKLRNAYQGGPGGIDIRNVAGGVEFGVSGAAIPYAAVHRGGAGKILAADAAIPQRTQVTQAMRGYLGAALGVRLRKTTRELVTPRRPHATANPEVRTRVTAIFAANAAGRAVPPGLLQ